MRVRVSPRPPSVLFFFRHRNIQHGGSVDRHLADLAFALLEDGALKAEPDPTTPAIPLTVNVGAIAPKTLEAIGQELNRYVSITKLKYDAIVGVPDAGIALASALHIAQLGIPRKKLFTVHRRKRNEKGQKDRPNDKPRFNAAIEGDHTIKDRVLLIDGYARSGRSISETTGMLRSDFRLVVEDCLLLIELRPFRERGQSIAGLRIHSVFKLEDLVTRYDAQAKIAPNAVIRIMNYLETP